MMIIRKNGRFVAYIWGKKAVFTQRPPYFTLYSQPAHKKSPTCSHKWGFSFFDWITWKMGPISCSALGVCHFRLRYIHHVKRQLFTRNTNHHVIAVADFVLDELERQRIDNPLLQHAL